MATYRYQFCDALTGVLLEEAKVDCQGFSQQINGAGTLAGTLPLGQFAAASTWRTATVPKRTLVIVLRDDQVVWGGILLKRRPTAGGIAAEIGAETLEGYWSRRRIKTDLTQTAQDVFDIVRAIVTQLQGVTGGNLRMAVTAGSAGYTTTVTYLGKDRTKALDAWQRLAEVSPGFEFTVTWARSGSVYTPTLNLATPGLNTGLDALVLEYPGNVIVYDYPENGADSPNALTGIGADSGGSPLLYEAVDSSGEIAAGVPIFEAELSMKDESDTPRLTSRTTTALNAGLVDSVVPTVDLRGDADPGFSSIPLGCPVRLRATSPYHPAGTNGVPGLDVTRRVTGWTVAPGAQEKVTLALASATGKVRAPLAQRGMPAYLADLERRVKQLETI